MTEGTLTGTVEDPEPRPHLHEADSDRQAEAQACAEPGTETLYPTGQAHTLAANCAEARAAGAAPIHRGEPGYSRKLDRDGDGIACE